MSLEILINKIKEKFKKFENEWILLFGSQMTEYMTPRSDIDVVLITKLEDKEEIKKIFYKTIAYNSSPFDFKIFEILPLHVQIGIINRYTVVFGDQLEISEYFYFFRKLWKDQERRINENQITTIEEYKIGLKNRKIVLKSILK